jgi:type IV secretion system protein VirB5
MAGLIKNNKNEESNELALNPFLAGRTEAAERYKKKKKNAAQWRGISAVLILCCAACVLSVIFMAGRVTVVPYIVQVDSHGYSIAVEPVAPSRVDSRLLIAQVARYVWSLRTVFNDPEAQLHLMSFIYSTTPVNTPAERKYQDFFNANNPVVIGETQTVNVTVNSVLPMSSETWQAEWTEERFALTGDRMEAKHYRGIFSTAIVTPSAMREVLANPLGIFITDFNFSEVL